jgi:prevent-host-death family protein
MESVGVRELRDRVSELLRRVRDEGEVIEVTYHGEVVARLVPARPAAVDLDEMAALWTSLDQLAAEIGASWPEGASAREAVAADRRELS